MAGSPSRKTVAVIEASKGLLVLVAGCGILSLVHRDVRLLAQELVGHLHLNPAKGVPEILVEAATNLDDARLTGLAVLALAYVAARLAIAYGLWRGRAWAEWLAALSGAIYLPFELEALAHGVTPLRVATLGVNLLVVGLMATALYRRLAARTG